MPSQAFEPPKERPQGMAGAEGLPAQPEACIWSAASATMPAWVVSQGGGENGPRHFPGGGWVPSSMILASKLRTTAQKL
jgi:hypothetical protein